MVLRAQWPLGTIAQFFHFVAEEKKRRQKNKGILWLGYHMYPSKKKGILWLVYHRYPSKSENIRYTVSHLNQLSRKNKSCVLSMPRMPMFLKTRYVIYQTLLQFPAPYRISSRAHTITRLGLTRWFFQTADLLTFHGLMHFSMRFLPSKWFFNTKICKFRH